MVALCRYRTGVLYKRMRCFDEELRRIVIPGLQRSNGEELVGMLSDFGSPADGDGRSS